MAQTDPTTCVWLDTCVYQSTHFPKRPRNITAMHYRLLALSFLCLVVGCDMASESPSDDAEISASPLAHSANLDDARRFHPIVLSEHEGADLGRLVGADPGDIVAFAYDTASRQFRQIPVQADERFVYDVALIYEGLPGCPYSPSTGSYGSVCNDLDGYVTMLGYADPNTVVGPDPDPTFDDEDELALLLSDFGDQGRGHPRGVRNNTRTEVTGTLSGTTYYAYLYVRRSSTLTPSAGQDYVDYSFDLVNEPYNRIGILGLNSDRYPPPPDHGASNPENTVVTGQWYEVEFADRWIMDVLRIGEPGGLSEDLLELDQIRFSDDPSTPEKEGCGRTSWSASQGEGGFLVNRDGPVRAIRRIIGFNSGPLTELTWTFYPYNIQVEAFYRVHPMPQPKMFFDLSDAVTTHSYAYGDGNAPLSFWQTLALPSLGGWALLSDFTTDIAFSPGPRPFYKDDASDTQCTFDNTYHRAAHGMEVPFQGTDVMTPNTDPSMGPANQLEFRRNQAFGPDSEAARDALLEVVAITTRG